MENVVCMYINAVASSVMLQLYLRHYFHNTMFKSNRNYIVSGPALPPNEKYGSRKEFLY
jgi:hypothetical protein